MATIAAVLIVKNEADVLARCLDSLDWVDEIVLVDDESEDETIAIAEEHGAKVYRRALDRFDVQRNYAMDQATSDWILSIDADEQVPAELAEEIRQVIDQPDALDVYGIPFLHQIFGRWIRHGGWTAPLTRLYRRGVRWSGAVHEQVVKGERYGTLRYPLLHYSHRTVAEFITKLNGYTDREGRMRVEAGATHSNPKLVLSPLRDFWRRYVAERGYRDGSAGLVLAALMAGYVFCARAKSWELLEPADEPAPDVGPVR